MNPINYKIHLEPDLHSFQFSGTTDISIEATGPVGEISLNALELEILCCQVLGKDGLRNCPFVLDPKKEMVTISLPDEMSGAKDRLAEVEDFCEFALEIAESNLRAWRERRKNKTGAE